MYDFEPNDMAPDSYVDSNSDSQREKDKGSSDGSDTDGNVKVKSKGRGINCYGLLKVLNCMLYLATLGLTIGYFRTTKYESIFVFYMFQGLLIGRPAIIGFYSLIMICLEMRRRTAKPPKDKTKKN